jgi:hypothetical protein
VDKIIYIVEFKEGPLWLTFYQIAYKTRVSAEAAKKVAEEYHKNLTFRVTPFHMEP